MSQNPKIRSHTQHPASRKHKQQPQPIPTHPTQPHPMSTLFPIVTNPAEASKNLLSIYKARHSCRGFTNEAIPKDTIQRCVELAQLTPSNCNTQPWEVHIVSGEALKKLSEALVDHLKKHGVGPVNGVPQADFVFDQELFTGKHSERQVNQGTKYYESIKMDLDNHEGRAGLIAHNLQFYGAQHVALLFMKDIGEGNVRQASDVGQWGMSFMSAVTAEGFACIPQTIVGMFAEPIRQFLKIPKEHKMLCAISFGVEDTASPANGFRMERAPVGECVTFHE